MQRLNLSWKKKRGNFKKNYSVTWIYTLLLSILWVIKHTNAKIFISLFNLIFVTLILFISIVIVKFPFCKNANIYCLETTVSIMDNPDKKKHPWKEDPYEISRCPITAPSPHRNILCVHQQLVPSTECPLCIKSCGNSSTVHLQGVSWELWWSQMCIPTESKELEGSN